ncbi:MAG: hypothetical protein J0H67_20545 [Rhodospirillales bacterium]|nr:hypothetical protein [Rhodospirillales bacterium]MBN8905593.1 hypothetical protein [Rhodospirillales bacterium]
MPFDAPFNLGPFAVDASGRLAPRNGTAESPGFLLSWRGRSVHAHLQDAEGASRLVLEVALGRIPSTAGERTLDQRPRSFATLRVLPTGLPEGWRLHLTPDHRLRLKAERLIELPITVTLLVTELTCFLLTLAPFLDLLDEVGMPVGPAAQG